MRDFRDAKAMANTIRATLADEGIKITVSQSLELTAKAFGLADWNTMSAAINTGADTPRQHPIATPFVPAESTSATERVGFSANLETTLNRALADAKHRNHERMTLEHLLLALIDDSDASAVLKGCQVDLEILKKALSEYLDKEPKLEAGSEPGPSYGFQRVIQRAVMHVGFSGRQSVTAANALVALFSEQESQAVRLLNEQAMTRSDAVNFIAHGAVKGSGDAAA
ncbi:Clp protease N-terminal domain-containing protein [Sphingomonas bacterium]|uniref:Clp protease N-terminal domain-containing protein n=1 Tax=Sphingomonas bacterium TaxID=1895847 RepID=UPI0026205977|nr:Clp protease N-terminal domain-containing protein [Sphingomonas bacterium]MDB5680161.1 clpA [Sphingomonas bacterium]